MILANSRYASSQVVAATLNGQPINVIVPAQPSNQTISYVSHLLTVNDRLDRLANQYYGDPTRWWQIANANPEIFPDWSSVPPGTVIRIPFS